MTALSDRSDRPAFAGLKRIFVSQEMVLFLAILALFVLRDRDNLLSVDAARLK